MNLEAKLAGPSLSPHEIADIVERHLGVAASEAACEDARTVLQRLRRQASNVYLRYALRPLEDEADARTAMRKVLATLRTWRHLSGA